ncbi:hypothetical protein EVAR_56960_1 [Eumeta japonica]|uniref:Secreted protein n=1 Tax=Eumeta variegata TaxID=151549 RepID=A0A4C1YQQ9_EUMVA|nr:hypothetical protein EVAR_56960_1 [Eumeta japonica]
MARGREPARSDVLILICLSVLAFALPNKDEKNQILTTNVWLNLVSVGRAAPRRRPRRSPAPARPVAAAVTRHSHASVFHFTTPHNICAYEPRHRHRHHYTPNPPRRLYAYAEHDRGLNLFTYALRPRAPV